MRLKRRFVLAGLIVPSKTFRYDNSATVYKAQKNSNWTELNKERYRRLEELGLMTESGRAVLPDMSENDFVINQDILALLQSDNILWQNFLSFPPLYQRVRIDTIQFNKHRPALYQSRLG